MLKADFAEKTGRPQLANAVIRQSGGWEDFQYTAPNVNHGGADAGHNGWISHCDTVLFTCDHWRLIMALLCDMAEEIGGTAAGLVSSFNCFRGDPPNPQEVERVLIEGPDKTVLDRHNVDDLRLHVYNALAWFALEEIAQEYDRIMEDDAA